MLLILLLLSAILIAFLAFSIYRNRLLQAKVEELIASSSRFEAQALSTSEYKSLYDITNKELYEVKMALELKIQEMHEFEKRVTDWDKSRSEAVEHAKAAVFETASALSKQLIDKHKTETKEAEERVGVTADKLQTQFESIVKNIAILNNEVKSSKETSEYIKQALLSPTGSGALAEITLENILKSSGLHQDRDFVMQYSFEVKHSNKKLRPDAVVFLPADNILVIDSKASKFFIEILNEDSEGIQDKLKASMRNHIRSLTSKDYSDSLRESLKDRRINHISNVMFVPSEIALEKLLKIDKDFMSLAWERDIFPVGPSGLVNILAYAKFQIAVTKQNENHNLIVDEVRNLMQSLAHLYEHAKRVGDNLYSATNHFDKFAGSFNTNLLPKARKLEKLGINLNKNKSIPKAIERFTILTSSKSEVIEVEQIEDEKEPIM